MSQTLAPQHVAASPTPTLPKVFAAAARAEWTKLRTVRSSMWALIFTTVSTVGLGVLLTSLEVSRWDHRTPAEATGFDPLLYSFAGINLAQLSIGVLGVLVMTSEYATGTIRLTFGATPQRRLLLAAKAATFSSVVGAVSLISCFSAFFICQALLAPKHAGVSISDPGVLRAVIGGAGHLVLIGAIAVAVGAALRRTAGAVAVLFAVLLVVPGLVTLLPSPWNNDITQYLPSSAGVAMSAVVRFPNLLTPAAGLLVLCGYTAAMLLVAAVALVRRDA
ncbi:ABC-2 type transport system permease protein [Streptacidiphilus sp. MAP12-16]|uniref:ABC transporter permease n=1 Tax=Streptacidiphilus sp. MAP12-16 TaxID=3156300 RepID=UPI003513F827